MRAVALALVLGLAATLPAAAQATGWVRTTSGCQIWGMPVHAGETVAWSGPCQGGKANGKGVLLRTQGAATTRFEGAMRDGRETGPGIMAWPNGGRYEGEFSLGLANGRGTMTTRSGMRYVGDWKNGQRTGQGTFTMPDGTRYTGEFLNGKPDGRGTQVFANGSRYEGAWKNGLPNGQGTGYGAVTGRVFCGMYRNGCLRTEEYVAAFGVPDSACK